jgi:hypothetical protein
MAGTATPIFPQTIQTGVVQFLPADTTALKTIVTPGANGCKVESLLISSTDTVARDMQIIITKGGTDYLLCTFNLTARAGDTAAAANFNVFASSMISNSLPKDVNGNPYLYLANGAVLKARMQATITAAKAVSVVANYGDF